MVSKGVLVRSVVGAFIGLMICIAIWGCQTVSPKQSFVNACATAGEAMAQVVAVKRADKVDQATYNQIDDLYDAAVSTCDTLPPTDDAATLALSKINEFLGHAAGVTGQSYPAY